jgi:hypothetical protein
MKTCPELKDWVLLAQSDAMIEAIGAGYFEAFVKKNVLEKALSQRHTAKAFKWKFTPRKTPEFAFI